MSEREEPRQPDLELDPEASANLRRLLERPSDPSSAADHLARARRALRSWRQRLWRERGQDEARAR
jgi:hypothetical protein